MMISLSINHQCSMIRCHSSCCWLWRGLWSSAEGSSGWCYLNPVPGERAAGETTAQPTPGPTKTRADPPESCSARWAPTPHLALPLVPIKHFNVSRAFCLVGWLVLVSTPLQTLPLLIQVVNLFYFLQELPHHQDQI